MHTQALGKRGSTQQHKVIAVAYSHQFCINGEEQQVLAR
jgi:hypothetical protein